MEMYTVGGCVRDEILGVKSKDIDFTVVFNEREQRFCIEKYISPYAYMVAELEHKGVKVIRNKDTNVPIGAEFLTARGIAPKDYPLYPGRALDFVLSRKEGTYSDGRRPDSVEVGTLEDDLARRDFTMNAIAKAADGSLIDPFNGQADIAAGIIRAVGNPYERIMQDALRAVRALRFSVTKGFLIEGELHNALHHRNVLKAVRDNISDDRINKELQKMLRFDQMKTMAVLLKYSPLTEAMFAGSVSLDSTMKTKGRGNA